MIYTDRWWQQYLDTTPLYQCSDCKFANEYVAYWWYPYFDPTCSKGHGCNVNKGACSDFKLIGRQSR